MLFDRAIDGYQHLSIHSPPESDECRDMSFLSVRKTVEPGKRRPDEGNTGRLKNMNKKKTPFPDNTGPLEDIRRALVRPDA
jgi:hypothetical protein